MLGVAIIVAQKDFGLMHSVVYAVATAIGFGLALTLFGSHATAVATAITKVTAILIPKADSRFFETPIKGQMLALTILGAVREILGTGAVFGYQLYSADFGALIFVLAPGAFIVLGLLIALAKWPHSNK
mgnify:CR=1 FL=1